MVHVVDASIFPTMPRRYTHVIVLITALRIADGIKLDWRQQGSITGVVGCRTGGVDRIGAK